MLNSSPGRELSTQVKTEVSYRDRLEVPREVSPVQSEWESPGRGARSRSVTPVTGLGRAMLERHRKTPIPVLCSRAHWMAENVTGGRTSPISMIPHKRSLDVDGRGPSPRMACSTISLSTIGRTGLSQEDIRGSIGNIYNIGEFFSFISCICQI